MSNSIHVLRAEKRLSQQQLAEAIGVTRATVNALEGGNYNPSLELAFRLARFFELNLNDIFKVEGERHE
ncbi:MAG: transcriptional regulator [Bdellovibrio sp. CG12_big_fil_rev_8_21_14_0_65_39_13]|nr:MAG: transcriptional regulator [Bdellovibrio sp. CG22_combo_CG10-13_8_21_14_all_39_27]PIQ61504.1 MAG: transcriptional regulator [Bdellovibrio sp. CG12_big_fil_rev_8_21_14_0_65_39_13]PIR35354.1 MAG: transcriptional regulator [Bdellovibrio sp. CG11_big_fil_rev_8_21_14_0_20_39_38]PJB53660.1 MAG: transcriptional regulator [Bdellovibrio sp. CG_4_9_14_3_um_filter_39_7]